MAETANSLGGPDVKNDKMPIAMTQDRSSGCRKQQESPNLTADRDALCHCMRHNESDAAFSSRRRPLRDRAGATRPTKRTAKLAYRRRSRRKLGTGSSARRPTTARSEPAGRGMRLRKCCAASAAERDRRSAAMKACVPERAKTMEKLRTMLQEAFGFVPEWVIGLGLVCLAIICALLVHWIAVALAKRAIGPSRSIAI